MLDRVMRPRTRASDRRIASSVDGDAPPAPSQDKNQRILAYCGGKAMPGTLQR